MPTSVGANKLSVVHKKSNGTTIAFPDVCKTPTPGGPVPIPYPNIALAQDSAQTSKTVSVDGNLVCVQDSNFSTSTGDEAGTAGGGVASSKTKGKAEFVNYSFDVQVEGKGVPRAFDLMCHNDKNTPPAPLLQEPVVALGKALEDGDCLCCKEPAKKKAAKKKSAPATAAPKGKQQVKDVPDQPELSGPAWCARFEGSSSLSNLEPGFGKKVEAFIDALETAGADVDIAATFRPRQRAYLMHWAFMIARAPGKKKVKPEDVPAFVPKDGEDEVRIDWEHDTEEESVQAAEAMCKKYRLKYEPALESNHTKRLAVDMNVEWDGDLMIELGPQGTQHGAVTVGVDNSTLTTKTKKVIPTGLRDGNNKHLHQVGASYGVIKLADDPPHWSYNGR